MSFDFECRMLRRSMSQALLGKLREHEMRESGRFRQLLHFPKNPVHFDERERAAVAVEKMAAENAR